MCSQLGATALWEGAVLCAWGSNDVVSSSTGVLATSCVVLHVCASNDLNMCVPALRPGRCYDLNEFVAMGPEQDQAGEWVRRGWAGCLMRMRMRMRWMLHACARGRWCPPTLSWFLPNVRQGANACHPLPGLH